MDKQIMKKKLLFVYLKYTLHPSQPFQDTLEMKYMVKKFNASFKGIEQDKVLQ